MKLKKQNSNFYFLLLPLYKLQGFMFGDFKENKLKYIKSTILIFLFGLFISSIVIAISGANPFTFFFWVWKIALDPLFLSSTLVFIAMYILGSINLSFGFKCNIFNIGIASQMMLAGALVLILGIKLPHLSQFESIFLSLIIASVSGGLLSLLSATLKIFFNVHEVISTIMLNWVIYYFLKWLFIDKGTSLGIWDTAVQISMPIINPNFSLTIGHNQWILPVIISLIFLAFIWLIIFKTSFGYKVKILGSNIKAAKYAGIKSNLVLCKVMLIQGIIGGILGMIYYMCIEKGQLNFSTETYPLFGFNCFATSLIAYNNPIGIFFVSIIWGVLDSGGLPTSQLPQFHISKNIIYLVFGIILYCATISIIFIKWKPWILIKEFYCNRKFYNSDYLAFKKEYKIKKTSNKNHKKELKSSLKKAIKLLINEYNNSDVNDLVIKKQLKTSMWIKINWEEQTYKNNVKINTHNLQHIKTKYIKKYKSNYQNYNNVGKLKIKNEYYLNYKLNLFDLLNNLVAAKYNYKINLFKETKNKANINNLKNIKQTYKNEWNNSIYEEIQKYKTRKANFKNHKKFKLKEYRDMK